VNSLACQQLDKLETAFPVITKPTDVVLDEAKALLTKAVQPTVVSVKEKVTAALRSDAPEEGRAPPTSRHCRGRRCHLPSLPACPSPAGRTAHGAPHRQLRPLRLSWRALPFERPPQPLAYDLSVFR